MNQRNIKLLVMADGSSIHTEKWIQGLALQDEFEIFLLTMNPAGVRAGIVENKKVKRILKYIRPAIFPSGIITTTLKKYCRLAKWLGN